MIKKLNKFLSEISKLSKKEQELLSNLNYFQVQILKILKNKKNEKISKLIKLDDNFSRAQKYRYIHNLVELQICQITNKGLEIKK